MRCNRVLCRNWICQNRREIEHFLAGSQAEVMCGNRGFGTPMAAPKAGLTLPLKGSSEFRHVLPRCHPASMAPGFCHQITALHQLHLRSPPAALSGTVVADRVAASTHSPGYPSSRSKSANTTMPSSPFSVPLPPSWPRHAKTAMLHVISLAHFVLTHVRGWAANSPIHRVRLAAMAGCGLRTPLDRARSHDYQTLKAKWRLNGLCSASPTVTAALAAAAMVVGSACAPAWPGPASAPVVTAATASPFAHGGPASVVLEGAAAHGPMDATGSLPSVCIGATRGSAGQRGASVLYRVRREGADALTVGYFVYWSTERPWGANWLTYTVLPALLVDAIYTHFLFVLPGLQRAIYGPGDVEGVRVEYRRRRADGAWTPIAATADDAFHHEVGLSPDDFVADDGRLVFLGDGWSHQLAAPGGRRFARAPDAELTCYAGAALRPLDDETTRLFRLGSPSNPRRATPAWGGSLLPPRVKGK